MKTCTVEGCEKPVKARGWCPMHYTRWAKTGEPGQVGPIRHIVQHGTVNEYQNFGCRCDLCKTANSQYMRERLIVPCPGCGGPMWGHGGRRLCIDCWHAKMRENPVHGTEGGYKRGCRCEECKEGANRARRERRHRNPASREQENRKRMERYYRNLSPMQKATSARRA